MRKRAVTQTLLKTNGKNSQGFPANHSVKLNENKKKDKYLDLVKELKKNNNIEHESESDTHWNWCARYSPKKIGTRTGRYENKRTGGGETI